MSRFERRAERQGEEEEDPIVIDDDDDTTDDDDDDDDTTDGEQVTDTDTTDDDDDDDDEDPITDEGEHERDWEMLYGDDPEMTPPRPEFTPPQQRVARPRRRVSFRAPLPTRPPTPATQPVSPVTQRPSPALDPVELTPYRSPGPPTPATQPVSPEEPSPLPPFSQKRTQHVIQTEGQDVERVSSDIQEEGIPRDQVTWKEPYIGDAVLLDIDVRLPDERIRTQFWGIFEEVVQAHDFFFASCVRDQAQFWVEPRGDERVRIYHNISELIQKCYERKDESTRRLAIMLSTSTVVSALQNFAGRSTEEIQQIDRLQITVFKPTQQQVNPRTNMSIARGRQRVTVAFDAFWVFRSPLDADFLAQSWLNLHDDAFFFAQVTEMIRGARAASDDRLVSLSTAETLVLRAGPKKFEVESRSSPVTRRNRGHYAPIAPPMLRSLLRVFRPLGEIGLRVGLHKDKTWSVSTVTPETEVGFVVFNSSG